MRETLPKPRCLALVVDDDEFVREFVRQVLDGQGFEVHVAGDGKTAAFIFDKHSNFSLIVTDILMPGGDGIDFILKIRRGSAAGAAQPKIVAISGGGLIPPNEYLESARGLGADITIYKPFSARELTAALSSLGFDSISAGSTE